VIHAAWFDLLIFGGVAVVLIERRLGVFLIVVCATGSFVTRLAASVVSYRRTMRRPWPKCFRSKTTRMTAEGPELAGAAMSAGADAHNRKLTVSLERFVGPLVRHAADTRE
jgi:hypothetical protein